MHPFPSQSTNDLRSRATDLKRDIESKHKWEPKWAAAYDIPTVKPGPNNTKRPTRLSSQRQSEKKRRVNEKSVNRTRIERKQDVLSSKGKHVHDSSSDNETSSLDSATPEPEIKDPLEGYEEPDRGMEILGMALNKAVERHDQRALLKLVKDEYEVLDASEDEDKITMDEDDDYEMI